MATLTEFETARAAFVAAPSATTKRAMLGAYPVATGVASDGVSTGFRSLAELEAWADRALAEYRSTESGGGPRVILGRVGFGGGR